jgi:hypothetical protein
VSRPDTGPEARGTHPDTPTYQQILARGIHPAEAAGKDPEGLALVEAFCLITAAEPMAAFGFERSMQLEDMCERVFSILNTDSEDLPPELQWTAALPRMSPDAEVRVDGRAYYWGPLGWSVEPDIEAYDPYFPESVDLEPELDYAGLEDDAALPDSPIAAAIRVDETSPAGSDPGPSDTGGISSATTSALLLPESQKAAAVGRLVSADFPGIAHGPETCTIRDDEMSERAITTPHRGQPRAVPSGPGRSLPFPVQLPTPGVEP